jgi:hypothetical protein
MATQSAPTGFDPALWLRALTAIGGGYALASDRKLHLIVSECPDDDLTPVMAQVIGQPDRIDAVRIAIERRQIGDA